MDTNEQFRPRGAHRPEASENGAAVPLQVVNEPCAPRPDFAAILAHPCTYILVGFAAGIWFSSWIESRKK